MKHRHVHWSRPLLLTVQSKYAFKLHQWHRVEVEHVTHLKRGLIIYLFTYLFQENWCYTSSSIVSVRIFHPNPDKMFSTASHHDERGVWRLWISLPSNHDALHVLRFYRSGLRYYLPEALRTYPDELPLSRRPLTKRFHTRSSRWPSTVRSPAPQRVW